jgi:hypothetical protein
MESDKELVTFTECIICNSRRDFPCPIEYKGVYVCPECKRAIKRLKREQRQTDFKPYN